ncbi:chromatin assembly factor 1 subunit A [Cylas formicarius]|uniref:chromatin assembly factor 1 subunit A n=1 Tax=Cylas formicarius TaxID=197179 RepID=UPI002958A10E|nr:chromatin assembly factor 1 subunit A [Cylas formicarius]
MFGLSIATQLLQGSTQRTWNYLTTFGYLVWSKFVHLKRNTMPRSRKRHHSHSKSRSRSHSRDRSSERHKRIDSHEKDGKRRKIDSLDSPHKRSLSQRHSDNSFEDVCEDDQMNRIEDVKVSKDAESDAVMKDSVHSAYNNRENSTSRCLKIDECDKNNDSKQIENSILVITSDREKEDADSKESRNEKSSTPLRQSLTPKQLHRKLESEKKRQLKQEEREERLKKKEAEKNRIREEKEKQKQQKDAEKIKQLEEKQQQKQKEKEMKEEQRRKEKEEKEQKRKEKEDLKRKEKEMERLKKQQEAEEKNKEKQKEEEKKQKTAALFVNFFKKTDTQQDDKKIEKANSQFMPFEVKSDMRLPPLRRKPLTNEDVLLLDNMIETQNEKESYLHDLKSVDFKPRKTPKTWPTGDQDDDVTIIEEDQDDDVTIIEEDKKLGETICGDAPPNLKFRAKFLCFHENKRPPYYGTWRKTSQFVKPRRPFAEDSELFNYEEDSDDDWEEEEQGESLDVSDDEADKDIEEDKDDYEVDNDFFVPHGHLSDDEIDDEENARLSPESMKQKLKLLKDEFEADIHSKTHKLKPRSIGCIWYNRDGVNVETAIQKYLQPFAIIIKGQIEIKKRSDIFVATPERKKVKIARELAPDQISSFLEFIHGNTSKKKVLIEEYLTHMVNNGSNVDVSKITLLKLLKEAASFIKCKENGPTKNKLVWVVKDDLRKKYNMSEKPGCC